jgi:hypothetical protein
MRLIVSFLVLVGVVVAACNEKEVISYPSLSDYYPLKVGRTYTYMLDSIKPTNFGAALNTTYYLAKDSVESQFNDAQGRPSFRIYRYLRDTPQTKPWTYLATYVATFDDAKKQVEYVDDRNYRYIILKEPVTEGFSWKGNSFIDTRSSSSLVKYMDDWDYTYQNLGQSFTTRKGKFDTTISVLHVNQVSPPGPFDPNNYQQTDYSIEVYAKGVGLIYKEFIHKTWQKNPSSPGYWDQDPGNLTYGIKLNLRDYK